MSDILTVRHTKKQKTQTFKESAMNNWYQIFPKNTWLSTYVWIIFFLLPFYFIIRSSTVPEIILGVIFILLFFVAYRLTFLASGWLVYFWVGTAITISIIMTLFYGYVYFSLFLAFFIGNVKHKTGFYILYGIHLLTAVATINILFFTENELFLSQFPFIVISVIGIILLPFNTFNRNKREKLESQLKDANQKISQMVVMEERQRIARDLHDTLGQKLSLVGLKSDLAGKLIDANPEAAKREINDISQTSRTALKEVREMVSDMRGTKLKDELIRIEQVLKAAEVEFTIKDETTLEKTPPLVENVLSMCLKEAVTNIVKHSKATTCLVELNESVDELSIRVKDNGTGITGKIDPTKKNGLRGMEERLEFVNGTLEVLSKEGTELFIRVPTVVKQVKQEGMA